MAPDASLAPIPETSFAHAEARHLLRRTCFGGTDEQVSELVELGPRRSVDQLLAQLKTDDAWPVPTVDPDIIRPPTEDERRDYMRARRDGDEEKIQAFQRAAILARQKDQKVLETLRVTWLERIMGTTTPLRENLVLLWHDHFATRHRDIRDANLMQQQQAFFREHCDRFDLLARGIVRDPAMLRFLNNDRNVRRQPNENLARELMELFTLGEGNYTENDIKAGARALTGYHVEDNDFVFHTRRHDPGRKDILGSKDDHDGDSFADLLLRQKTCSQLVAMKLYDHFVLDVAQQPREMPSTSKRFILRLAARVRQHSYKLRPVLRDMLLSRHFYEPEIIGQKIKSPAHLLAHTARTLDTPRRDTALLERGMRLMGQTLYDPPSVAGWEGGRAWINTATLFARQNATTYQLTGQTPRQNKFRNDRSGYDPSALLKGNDAPATIVDRAVNLLLGEHIDEERRRLLVEFLHSRGDTINRETAVELLMLVTTMPEYQLC